MKRFPEFPLLPLRGSEQGRRGAAREPPPVLAGVELLADPRTENPVLPGTGTGSGAFCFRFTAPRCVLILKSGKFP